jgi:hypothetical protein
VHEIFYFLTIRLVCKGGDVSECTRNRTIVLITHASKILLRITQKRHEPYMEREMPTEQVGFRKWRGTRDQSLISVGHGEGKGASVFHRLLSGF